MKPSCSEVKPGNPFNFSEAAIRAVVDSYSLFGLDYFPAYCKDKPYVVLGYRNSFTKFFGVHHEVVYSSDPGEAWSFVYLLRLAKKTQDINRLLKEVGIT